MGRDWGMPRTGQRPGELSSKLLDGLPLLLIALLAVLFYFPVLFQHKTQIHAEGVSLGIALMHMLVCSPR